MIFNDKLGFFTFVRIQFCIFTNLALPQLIVKTKINNYLA